MDVVAAAKAAGVRLVRFTYCDFSGVIRCKAVHASRLARRLREGVGITRAQMAMNLLEQLVDVEGMEPVGEVRLVADPETFTVLAWAPANASVRCDQLNHDHRDWGACPRTFLKRAIARAADRGVTVRAAFENEFFLARRREDGRFEPFDDAPVYTTIGMDLVAGLVDDIVAALEAQGLQVETAMNEYGRGQQEIAIGYADALRAADNQLTFRDTVRGVAQRHGLLASFAPKPFPETVGCGAHIHLSVWDAAGERNLLHLREDAYGLSELGRHVVAGILDHLPAVVALTAPSYNSYRRLQPGAWSSAFTAWGFDNREAAVRVVSPFWGREEESANLEYKPCDPSANPYLALGAVILAALDGIDRRLDPGESCEHDPARLSERERTERGIRALPSSLAAALDELEKDDLLGDALGGFMRRAYLAVRRSEEAAFAAEEVDFEIAHHIDRF
jgi:glutamine synthetase